MAKFLDKVQGLDSWWLCGEDVADLVVLGDVRPRIGDEQVGSNVVGDQNESSEQKHYEAT